MMETIQYYRFFILVFLLTAIIGISKSASLERPSCSRRYMLFKHRHVYTYDYMVHVSSAFLGASPSMSVTRLTCTVTIRVPRKCEHVMQLSDCSVLERVQKTEDTYIDVPSAKQFIEDLQRYSIYFQMNKGVVIEDSILVHDEDTLQVLNFKRGIISALQVPVLEKDENINLTDIFGSCPVDYEILEDSFADRSVISKRDLKKCLLPNVYSKHINVIPGPSIGQMIGGVSQQTISEFIYPFEMPLSCQHDLNKDKTIVTVDCLQRQYFKPLAYTGDYLVTAITNVSQKLEFKTLEARRSQRPDLSLRGKSVIGIKFDFGVDFNRVTTVKEIRGSLAVLMEGLAQSNDDEKFETVPGKFGDLVQKLRATTQDVLEEMMEEVFVCSENCDHIRKQLEQVFFLDGLESCGTESCLQVFLMCMKHGYTSHFQTETFFQGLRDITQISETLLVKVFEHCKTRDESSCWLTLGSILSKSNISSPADVKEDSVLYKTLHHLHARIKSNCLSGILLDTERQLNTALKAITNVGFKVVQSFTETLKEEERKPFLNSCMLNRIIPTSFKISVIQNMENTLLETKYADIPQVMEDVFLEVLKDDTQDTSIRALAFSLLMKTTNEDKISYLVDIMMNNDNTLQMKAFMTSAVRTLLQNDAPSLKQVRTAWEKVKKEKYFHPGFNDFNPFSASFSKSVAGGYFFKIPVSEIFGGQLEADFIYDPSSKIFSTLKTAISYHYGEEKYHLFQFMVRVKGFDMFMDAMLKRINLTPMEMFDLYRTLKARAQGQGHGHEKFAKFQQNIVKAVENIMKEVNHPSELDFDISLDVSVEGKEVMFLSLKELMSMMREMRAKLPPKTSLAEVYLKKLMSGITKRAVKSKEMVGLVRDLPTCAGLPLNLTVHAYGTHLIADTIQSNLALFIAGGKKGSPTLSFSTTPVVRLLHQLHGELGVSIGTSHTSGMKATILFGGGREYSLKLTYGYSDPKVLVENPTKKRLEFELKRIYENKYNNVQKIFYARGKMELHHYSGVEEIGIDNSVQTTYKECNSDQWISMITRKKMCLEFIYPDVATSKTHAFFPLSGPFDLDVTIEDLEGASVDHYTLIIEYERKKVPAAGYTDHLDITHIGTGIDKTETKYAFCNFVYSRDDSSLTIDSELIDFHYTYAAKFSNTWHRHFTDFTVYEMLSKYGLAVQGHLFQISLKKELDAAVFDYHWNITTPQIGWDIHLQMVSSDKFPSKIGDRSFDISISYYCSKDMPLLYMFHLIPSWAAENNDVTNIRLMNSLEQAKVNEKKQPFSGAVEFYGRKLAWNSYIKQDGPTTHAHKTLTYYVGGVQKTATMDYSHTWGQSMKGLTLDLSGNLDAENFNVIGTGSCSLSKTEVVVSGDVNFYNKKEDNTSRRKRRSSIYDKMKAAEESAVNRIVQIKNKMFGPHMLMDDPKPQEKNLQHLIPLQDTYFPKYSIWDLENWNADLYLSSQLRPVFEEGVTPGTAPPKGLEATGSLSVQYPWNGGYVIHEENFSAMTNIRNTFRDFRIQLKGDMNTSYTAFDGTPIMNDGLPLVIKRSGEIHTYRKQGNFFDFVFKYEGPNLQKEYSILFDWDASTHHDPLYHVRSVQSGDVMPFFNHDYDEKMFYERGHIIHNMDFSHKMLTISMDSEINISPKSEAYFHQNGSVSFKVMQQVWSFDFENKAKRKQLQSIILPGSLPGISYSYHVDFTRDKELSITGFKKVVTEDLPTLLWITNVQLQGSTLINVKQTWTQAYREEMENTLRQGMRRKAMMIQAAGYHIRANLDKPLTEQSFLFVHFTPGDLIKQALMPNFIRGMKFWGRFLGNVIPTQYQPDSPNVPGPVIAPRFSILMQALKDSESSGPNPMIRKLQFMDYVLLKAFSNILLSVSESEFYSQKIEEILRKEEYNYMISTTPMIFDEIYGFPSLTEFHKHVYDPAKEAFKFSRQYYYYSDKTSFYTTSKSVAIIFGRHDSHRELGIQTFDGNFFHLTAEHSEECSYLLAADLRQKRWSLILSSAGVTLLTPGKTITVGWDKNVYLDNCKQPSIEINDEGLTVLKTDDVIVVNTPFGLSLEFDTVHDNCLVAIDGPYRNETIGLLGTNDKEEVTDFRLKHGGLTKDEKKFAAEYVVTGPQICFQYMTKDSMKQEPECEDKDRTCERAFTSQYYNDCYETFHYSKYCKQTKNRCNSGLQPCHAVKAYIDICRKKGRIDESAKIKGTCQIETPLVESPMTGSLKTTATSLDIVFVVSYHVSMADSEVKVIDIVSELALLEAWDQFSEVRLGVVFFGGSDEAFHVIRLEENGKRVFTERNDYDWDGLFDMYQQTTGSTRNVDAFVAIQEAARLPFNPVSQKFVIVLMTKEQSSGKAEDITAVSKALKEIGIMLNVLSTYKKTSDVKVIGINWEGKSISMDPGYLGTKSLPKNDYSELIMSSQGALWDLQSFSSTDNQDAKERMSEEFLAQIQQNDEKICPAS